MFPFDIENECNAWALIAKHCKLRLEAFPNDSEVDRKLLEDDDAAPEDKKLSFNMRNTIMFRKAEKEILQYMLKFNDIVKRLSKMSQKDAMHYVNQYEGEG